MTRRLFLVVFTLSLLIAPAFARVNADHLITAGQGIGRVKVGMPVAKAIAILGKPKATFPFSPGNPLTLYAWHDLNDAGDGTTKGIRGGLDLIVNQKGTVEYVQAWYAPEYATTNDLHTGVSDQAVRAAMGEPTKVESFSHFYSLMYLRQGITFRVGNDPNLVGYKTVNLIKVYAPEK